MEREKNREGRALLAALLTVAALHLLFMALSGKWIWAENPYNSYVLQACAWLRGRLDVDYRPWLELAAYGGKYYVSFPPFPSYVLLPFAALFGEQTPDGLLAFCVTLLGAAYAFRLARLSGAGPDISALLAVFLYGANNLWQITVDGWVWFLAQNLAFTLTLMALACARQGKKGRACFFLCAAVGCRPFQLLYFPVMCWLLGWAQAQAQEERPGRLKRLLWEKNYRLIPAAALAVSFLALNLARFGNPLEFGHNYLPEFLEAPQGQFSLSYLGENLYNLVRLPAWDAAAGRFFFPAYNGGNLFLVWPVLILYVLALSRRLIQAARARAGARSVLSDLALLALLLCHVFLLCLHRTLGGAHFGNRYIADLVPAATLFLCEEAGRWERAEEAPGSPALFRIGSACTAVLFVWGLWVNFTGVLDFYARQP